MKRRARGAIEGIVQGVGFRPFIFQLAGRFGLSGHVGNTDFGVDLEVEGSNRNVAAFMASVVAAPPPLAHIASVNWTDIPVTHQENFEIKKSGSPHERSALISPDVGICEDCHGELLDPSDRRFRYPFINCTNCGPRYTIITDVPYDRSATTMGVFQMCPRCLAEYEDPSNRRFHAQPNACWACGPVPSLYDVNGKETPCDDPIKETISILRSGAILAIKGLGGFHLCVDASNHEAVVQLRRRKHREEKPLAVMVRDSAAAQELVHVSPAEAELLCSRQKPIVLLEKKPFSSLSEQVAPLNRYLGVMLPYTPLHVLIMEGFSGPLVMTSGNVSEEPISRGNEEAFFKLHGIADYFLTHNRDIHLRGDDSVVRVVDDVPRQIRRSRGYVPVPVFLPPSMATLPQVLALGAELKNTICLTKKNRAFLSQHVGDLENLETYDFFNLTVSHLRRILEIHPEVLVHDLHPDYLSSRFAREQNELPTLAVQHHHAHIVSCLAEHGVGGPVIGLTMDGTGLGLDGAVWGGEVLLCDPVSFSRRAHLSYVPLPGGDAAAKSPWRMGLVYLYQAYGEDLFDLNIPFVRNLDRKTASLISQMAQKGVNSPLTSSCGRLFDGVSALIGIRGEIAYEGQAAIELEMCQDSQASGAYGFDIQAGAGKWIMETSPIIKGVVEDLLKGETIGVISRRFHNTLIQMLQQVCGTVRAETKINQVALSGGAFQNKTLLGGVTKALDADGFHVLSQAKVPANDGGLSLGQALIGGMFCAGKKGRYEETYEIHR
ncbi:MAG: carbamoyltransferase HypF [Deltaproteobacteria bacterium]|nr:carbamoyltransferase HypF [Deltaproteobacteria bacterium]